jgi:hypothetical protein
MALRVLTDAERTNIQGYQPFIDSAYWAIRNYADFWSTHNGASLSDSDRIKWVKDRMQAVNIVLNDINDPTVPLKFTKLSKGMQFDLDVAPVESSVIYAAFVADNKFEELASLYFGLGGENINFSISGN